MDEKNIKQMLRQLSEEKVPGLDVTEKVNKESKKHNDEYQKEVEKKMTDYEKDTIKNGKDDKVDVKVNATDKQKEIHDEVETLNGMEMVEYDQEPSDEFKERAEMGLKGDSKMGNATTTGKHNPETGEGNGNTEPVWGGSKADFGDDLVDRVKSSKKKRDDAKMNLTQFGDDIEPKKGKAESKKGAIKESAGVKRLRFKKPFNGVDKALKLIPEHVMKDDYVFEMTDGNERYKIRWEGNVNEGQAVVLESENAQVIKESTDKVMKLMNYDSKKSLGNLKAKDRLNEDKIFKDIFNKAKNGLK
jgi:hypothetical protein